MNEHPSTIIKHCKAARKSHVNVGLVVVFAIIVLTAGCHRSEEDEIRDSFAKIPDYLLGTKHRCQAFVLYTFARIEDIPDEARRIKMLHDFTDRLYSVDIIRSCPLENVSWEKKQDSLRRLRNRLDSLRMVSRDTYEVLRMFKRPLPECWEVKFRCLEMYKHYGESIEMQSELKPFDYYTLVREIEKEIMNEKNFGAIPSAEFDLLRTRFEEIVGRPVNTNEELDVDMNRWMKNSTDDGKHSLR